MLRLLLACILILITSQINLPQDLYAESGESMINGEETVELKDRLGTPVPSTAELTPSVSSPTPIPGPSPTPMKLAL